MGVGVSCVTSISAFDDLWRHTVLFFPALSSCLVCLSAAILQKCAAVNTHFFFAPAVNYSSRPRQGPVLTTPKNIRHLITGVGPRSLWPCQSGDPPSPNYQRNCSGISLPLERQKALTLKLWSQKWVPCGERLYPTTAEKFEVAPWRLEPAAVPPGCQNDHDSNVRFC